MIIKDKSKSHIINNLPNNFIDLDFLHLFYFSYDLPNNLPNCIYFNFLTFTEGCVI